MKHAIFLFLILPGIIFGQRLSKPIYIELNDLVSENETELAISFKIPFSNMVFVKDVDSYSSQIELNIEVWQEDVVIHRQSTNETVITRDYNLTTSLEYFVEGLLKIPLQPGSYSIIPTVNLSNTDKEVRLAPIKHTVPEISKETILKPIVVYDKLALCNDEEVFNLSNFGGSIPFSKFPFDLLIPVTDTSITNLKIDFIQDDSLLFSIKSDEYFTESLTITECENQIILRHDNSAQTNNYFLLRSINYSLSEGEISVKISNDSSTMTSEFNVEWIDKPNVLNNSEMAIELLEVIEGRDFVFDMLNNDSDYYYENLIEYWKQKDPVKETKFNELMNEFYTRADYAVRTFSSLGRKKNRIVNDRVKIYVKFGEPDEMKRTSTINNQVAEIWIYPKIKKEFLFVDENGTGEFNLKSE
ncbi:MAG: GWxTD domain-containing protein [Melioribacteraceae bacterium]|nr:GWxTD domain-containing protein [Melioribacteraceae bacterium]MCF8354863.1 GWxTD domain-containing protein [Melioribacteraceae bacterium]MCF8392970.1 GWxTD domain-containing protein [Melioribacteraceae bacterium]MCF8417287.1 GWxTD domain-containing protein [Melioribacteraceae bacterium]